MKFDDFPHANYKRGVHIIFKVEIGYLFGLE